MSDITVPVPDDRIPEFYQFFGRWLARELPSETGAQATGKPWNREMRAWRDDQESVTDATWLWGKLSKSARDLFSTLMDNPDRQYTATQLAEALNLEKGTRGVAGTLAWPGRYCIQANRQLPSVYTYSPEEGPLYWMTHETAELFRQAREKA